MFAVQGLRQTDILNSLTVCNTSFVTQPHVTPRRTVELLHVKVHLICPDRGHLSWAVFDCAMLHLSMLGEKCELQSTMAASCVLMQDYRLLVLVVLLQTVMCAVIQLALGRYVQFWAAQVQTQKHCI